jgi:UDP-2,3-diacylglucosamine pyrophosphatase LpxH
MSLLFVGDPHVTPTELEDAKGLIQGILARPEKTIVFLGDEFHAHSVLHLDVIDFWQSATSRLLAAGKRVVFLVGNHDMATSGVGAHAIQSITGFNHCPGVVVVDRAMVIADGVVGIPYQPTHRDFEHEQEQALILANGAADAILVCHQTFAGAQYENGFYAPDGLPLEKLRFRNVISGHIHRGATLQHDGGKVTYVGSPRWRTKSDAGEDKYVLSYPQGAGGDREFVRTGYWCTPIEVLDDTGGDIEKMRRWKHSRLTIVVSGEADEVKARCRELSAAGYAVLPRPRATAAPRVSESAPVMKSFQDFVGKFRGPHGTPGDRLAARALEYKQWQQ